MRIIEVILHKYERLSLSGLETLHYKPTATNQIIIGSNGCGKSSLLNELSPLPPDKKDMLLGGYKVFVTEHRGERYTLRSDYGKAVRHQFIHHGEGGDINLNDGGTTTAQKMLIEKTFGLTTELLGIWLGRTKFTQLSPVKRRDWILKLSNNDLDYAMRVFNLAKSETRDRQGVEKHFIKRLAEETADIADQNRVGQLEDQVAETTQILNTLLEAKDNTLASVLSVKYEIDRLYREFIECSSEALTLHLVKPACLDHLHTLGQLEEYVTQQVTKLESVQTQLEELYHQKETIGEAVKTLEINGVGEINGLALVNDSLKEEFNILASETPIYHDIPNTQLSAMCSTYDAVAPRFLEVLNELPDNTDGHFSLEKFKVAEARYQRNIIFIRQTTEHMRDLSHYLNHYVNHPESTCPECSHRFKGGFENFDQESVEKQIAEQTAKIEKAEAINARCEQYMEQFNLYKQSRDAVKNVIQHSPALNPLWRILTEEGLYKVHPTTHGSTIHSYGEQLKRCAHMNDIAQKIQLNSEILAKVSKVADGQKGFTSEYQDRLDVQINQSIVATTQYQRNIHIAKRFIQEAEQSAKCVRRANEVYSQLVDTCNQLIKADLNQQLALQVSEQQVRLATATSTLNTITRHDAVVQDIERQKELATQSLKHHQVVQNTLSPVDGLISKYIQSFLDEFIAEVNLTISEIWSYDMEVLSCGVDSTDVTCKFPLSINQGQRTSPDIAEASDGQVDIVNFAFRMAVAQYLDLFDYPLYLDELAPTFDEQHRPNLIRYLNRLIEEGTFNQMFMVSHYASNHYAFANAEILLLDDRNIVNIPGTFNTHATMTYAGVA